MRYAVAVDFCFPDAPGGSARVAWDIAQAARDRGWRVGLLCLNPRPGELPEGPTDIDGIQVIRYSKPVLPAWHPGRMQRQIAAAARGFAQGFGGSGWDLVHVHSPLTGAGALRAAPKPSRSVYTVHSPVVREQEIVWRSQGWVGALKLRVGMGMLRSLEQRLLDASVAIHVLSDFTRREMCDSYGLPRPVSVIPHWARTEFGTSVSRQEARSMLGWPQDARIFFTVRQHRERYGLDVAIDAFARLRERKNWRFYVGGDGPLRAALQDRVEALGIADRVRFTGILSDRELALAYTASDAFVLPTRALECFGLIILEAYACGCPVIATDAGAIPELVGRISPQLVVPAGSVDALCELIAAVLDGRAQLPSSEEVRNFAERLYGRAAILSRMFDFLEAAARQTSDAGSERRTA